MMINETFASKDGLFLNGNVSSVGEIDRFNRFVRRSVRILLCLSIYWTKQAVLSDCFRWSNKWLVSVVVLFRFYLSETNQIGTNHCAALMR